MIFITASCVLSLGCAIWGLKNYFSPGGTTLDLLFSVGSLAVLVGLILYERYFLKKLKNVSYL